MATDLVNPRKRTKKIAGRPRSTVPQRSLRAPSRSTLRPPTPFPMLAQQPLSSGILPSLPGFSPGEAASLKALTGQSPLSPSIYALPAGGVPLAPPAVSQGGLFQEGRPFTSEAWPQQASLGVPSLAEYGALQGRADAQAAGRFTNSAGQPYSLFGGPSPLMNLSPGLQQATAGRQGAQRALLDVTAQAQAMQAETAAATPRPQPYFTPPGSRETTSFEQGINTPGMQAARLQDAAQQQFGGPSPWQPYLGASIPESRGVGGQLLVGDVDQRQDVQEQAFLTAVEEQRARFEGLGEGDAGAGVQNAQTRAITAADRRREQIRDANFARMSFRPEGPIQPPVPGYLDPTTDEGKLFAEASQKRDTARAERQENVFRRVNPREAARRDRQALMESQEAFAREQLQLEAKTRGIEAQAPAFAQLALAPGVNARGIQDLRESITELAGAAIPVTEQQAFPGLEGGEKQARAADARLREVMGDDPLMSQEQAITVVAGEQNLSPMQSQALQERQVSLGQLPSERREAFGDGLVGAVRNAWADTWTTYMGSVPPLPPNATEETKKRHAKMTEEYDAMRSDWVNYAQGIPGAMIPAGLERMRRWAIR